jgi:hypothetical protein
MTPNITSPSSGPNVSANAPGGGLKKVSPRKHLLHSRRGRKVIRKNDNKGGITDRKKKRDGNKRFRKPARVLFSMNTLFSHRIQSSSDLLYFTYNPNLFFLFPVIHNSILGNRVILCFLV